MLKGNMLIAHGGGHLCMKDEGYDGTNGHPCDDC